VSVNGIATALKAAPSTLASNDPPVADEVALNVAEFELVTVAGLIAMIVSGALVEPGGFGVGDPPEFVGADPPPPPPQPAVINIVAMPASTLRLSRA
jgi:hypothetical protein